MLVFVNCVEDSVGCLFWCGLGDVIEKFCNFFFVVRGYVFYIIYLVIMCNVGFDVVRVYVGCIDIVLFNV